jgi:putative oxidoreductase
MRKWNFDLAVLLMRIGVGLVFIPHGYSKVFGKGGVAAFAADLPGYHVPAFLGYIAAYAEMFGAILLIVGLLTRVDAFLLACTMAVATFLVQLPDALSDVQPGAIRFLSVIRGIEMPFTLMIACLALILLGPGRISVDALVFRKNEAAAGAAANQTPS